MFNKTNKRIDDAFSDLVTLKREIDVLAKRVENRATKEALANRTEVRYGRDKHPDLDWHYLPKEDIVIVVELLLDYLDLSIDRKPERIKLKKKKKRPPTTSTR